MKKCFDGLLFEIHRELAGVIFAIRVIRKCASIKELIELQGINRETKQVGLQRDRAAAMVPAKESRSYGQRPGNVVMDEPR